MHLALVKFIRNFLNKVLTLFNRFLEVQETWTWARMLHCKQSHVLHPSVLACRAHCSFSRSEGRWSKKKKIESNLKKQLKHPPDNADIDYTMSCCQQHSHLTWNMMLSCVQWRAQTKKGTFLKNIFIFY